MAKTIRRELSPLVKVDDKTFEMTHTSVVTEVTTSHTTIAELKKNRESLVKAMDATERQKQMDIKRHDDSIAILNGQVQIIDRTIADAVAMGIIEEVVEGGDNPQAAIPNVEEV